ncbi:alpha/beta hydrolase [Pseudarthrobacter sp. P1]|uniref:alpha/beta hydrolase n=1 Tax=Pseudarthrobacter sp. P1 TaxID=3418418 RepID=UPI003CEEB6A4
METVLWSKPAAERRGTPLLLMLHGYGSNEEKMAECFGALPSGLTCAALRASNEMSGDYGWFLLDYFLANDFAEVVGAAGAVLAWLDAAQAAHGFSSVSLLGYSQGMAMATTLERLRPGLATAVVGLSGFVLKNPLLAAMEPLASRVPFYWARDTVDLVINPAATAFTAGWLAANTELTEATYEGMGHNIRADELVDVASFLTVNVPGAFRPSIS